MRGGRLSVYSMPDVWKNNSQNVLKTVQELWLDVFLRAENARDALG